jgi:hypothetical protein
LYVVGSRCGFKQGFDAVKGRKMNLPILDIEELVDKMKEKKVFCPLFVNCVIYDVHVVSF